MKYEIYLMKFNGNKLTDMELVDTCETEAEAKQIMETVSQNLFTDRKRFNAVAIKKNNDNLTSEFIDMCDLTNILGGNNLWN